MLMNANECTGGCSPHTKAYWWALRRITPFPSSRAPSHRPSASPSSYHPSAPPPSYRPLQVGIGMYLTPDFTLPRVLGALLELGWRRLAPASHKRSMLVVASGLVLGEGFLPPLAPSHPPLASPFLSSLAGRRAAGGCSRRPSLSRTPSTPG